jgi:hypothetical protein
VRQHEGVSDQLRAELRRAVADGGPAAPHAERALGGGPAAERLEDAVRALALHRGPDSSTCPSDAARAVGGESWRDLMPQAREVARHLAKAGDVEITQRGTVLDADGDWSGAIRIRSTR